MVFAKYCNILHSKSYIYFQEIKYHLMFVILWNVVILYANTNYVDIHSTVCHIPMSSIVYLLDKALSKKEFFRCLKNKNLVTSYKI